MKAEKHIQKMFPSLYGTGSLFMRLFPYILSMIKTDNLYFRGNLLPPPPNGIDYKSIIYIKNFNLLCQATFEALPVPVCRLFRFYPPTI